MSTGLSSTPTLQTKPEPKADPYSDPALNQTWWETSNDVPEYLVLSYEFISMPRGITLSRYIKTQCTITTMARMWRFSGSSQDWLSLDPKDPKEDPSVIRTFAASLDDDNHWIFVHDGFLYHSWWNRFTPVKVPIDNDTQQMLLQGTVPPGFAALFSIDGITFERADVFVPPHPYPPSLDLLA